MICGPTSHETDRPLASSVSSVETLLERHHLQIYQRPRGLSRRLRGLAALLVWRHGVTPHGPAGLEPLGQNTLFVLSQVPGRTRMGRAADMLVVRGYRCCFDPTAGQFCLGGPLQNVCAYDLRYEPFAEATGKIISSRRLNLLKLALDLDMARVTTVQETRCGWPNQPPLPRYWEGFVPGDLPPVPDNAATRQAALRAIDVDYAGPVLPDLRSPGGTLMDLDQDSDGTHLLFSDAQVVRLPSVAVLRPEVQIGRSLAPGVPLGDCLPRRRYPHWRAVAQILGERDSAWLLQQAVAALDESHAGLVCRRIEFVAGPLAAARGVFEDVRPLLNAVWATSMSPPVVWVAPSTRAFCFSRPGLQVDLQGLHSHWATKFELSGPIQPDE